MKISAVQFCPIFGDVDANSAKINDYCHNINSDVIVFPELAFTGYDFKDKEEVSRFAFDFNSENIQHFQNIASKLNKIIVIGFAEKAGSKLFNSAAIIFPDKSLSNVYRKVHLFFRERFYFDETDKGFFVIDYKERDIKIGTLICYDWRFPEASRTLALLGADLIVCPSNLVTKVWNISTPSRALENKVYFLVANRTGAENRNNADLQFNGASTIYNYNGSAMVSASQTDEEVITTEIFPLETRKKSFNEYNNIFDDRRTEFYS